MYQFHTASQHTKITVFVEQMAGGAQEMPEKLKSKIGCLQIPVARSPWRPNFVLWRPNSCRFSVQNPLHATLLVARILRWLPNFRKFVQPCPK
jgi:hypothetical protein